MWVPFYQSASWHVDFCDYWTRLTLFREIMEFKDLLIWYYNNSLDGKQKIKRKKENYMHTKYNRNFSPGVLNVKTETKTLVVDKIFLIRNWSTN